MILSRVSPTQISAYRACPRSWYFGWVLKRKSPSSESQIRGSDIHAHVEDYAQGKIEYEDIEADRAAGSFWLASLLAAIRAGEVPRQADIPGLLVEQHAGTMVFNVPGQAEVKANGKIDLTFPWPEDQTKPLIIRDWKSCKSFNYVKSPEALAEDDQCVFYANEMVARGWTGPVVFEHFYLRTNSAEYKKVRTKPLSQTYLREKFLDMERDVCDMARIASMDLAEVTKDKTACRRFGGCFHLDPCDRVPHLAPGVGLMASLNLSGSKGVKAPGATSPLASRLNAAQAARAAEPPPPPEPTRYEQLLETITAAADILAGVDDWEQIDVEATQATFHDDIYHLAAAAIEGGGAEQAVEPIKDQLEDIDDSDWTALVAGVGNIVPLDSASEPAATTVAAIPQGDINPPDASPNHHPAPGEEPLKEMGLDGRSSAPLERAGVVTMADLIGKLSQGVDLTDLDGVGATAAYKALQMAVAHLLSGKEIQVSADVPQVTSFDEKAEYEGRIEELQRRLQDEEGCRAKAVAAYEGLQAELTEGGVRTLEPAGLTLYVGCHTDGATPAQTVLVECIGEDLAGLYAEDYDNGKKSVAATFMANINAVKERYSEISFVGGGFFSPVLFEVLAPHATRIVRGA